MRFGHRVHGKITSYDEKGRGVFENYTVPFTTLGDEVTATFIKRDHKNKIFKLESVDVGGPDRIQAPCPHASNCGGCLWQHIQYDAQIKIKKDMVNSAFTQAGHDIQVSEVIHAKEKFHHRNRMDYCIGWNSEIGLKEYGSWSKYVDVQSCLLLNEDAGDILREVREWMKEFDILPWDAKFYRGVARYVVVREGKRTGERMIILVVHAFDDVHQDARHAIAKRLQPYATSILLGEQSMDTDISLAQKFLTLHGEAWIEEIVGDVRYRIHPNSFFQTNSVMAEVLQNTVGEMLGMKTSTNSTKKYLLDLYCGLGFFGIAFAKKNPQLYISGFELDAPAIELATYNAKINEVDSRCNFTAGPAEDLSWSTHPADVMIVDPPRSGLHPKVLKTIMDMAPPSIVYVSCNYHRLVEELKTFSEKYFIEKIAAIDMFPHTPHVEVVVKLQAKHAILKS